MRRTKAMTKLVPFRLSKEEQETLKRLQRELHKSASAVVATPPQPRHVAGERTLSNQARPVALKAEGRSHQSQHNQSLQRSMGASEGRGTHAEL
jgi:hypothetical protein